MRRYAVMFMALGLSTVAFAMLVGGGWGAGLGWCGVNFVAVGVAYGAANHAAFGKRDDGSMRALNVAFFGPYLALTWGTWHVARVLTREAPISVVDGGLMLARRLLPNEVPEDVRVVIDLTAEFSEREDIRVGRTYLALPILDGGVPDVAKLRRFLRTLPASTKVLIHCAQGHGRTALVAACLLLERGGIDANEAIARILSVRPGARMSRSQRAFVEAFAINEGPHTPA